MKNGNWQRINRSIVSAGLVNSDLKCYGKIEDLHLVSDENDTEKLNELFNLNS